MTTAQAQAQYENEHTEKYKDYPYFIYNPHNKNPDDLPIVFGFNNGGEPNWFRALSIAEDGVILAGHTCSSECYMPYDLGVIVDGRENKQEDYKTHYPDGFKCEFVSYDDVPNNKNLMKAIEISNKKGKEKQNDDATQL